MTLEELRQRLQNSRLHETEFYLLRPVTRDGYYLAKLEEGWEVGYSTGGGFPPRAFRVFNEISKACGYLWDMVVAGGRA
jgi:hypothetical protein